MAFAASETKKSTGAKTSLLTTSVLLWSIRATGTRQRVPPGEMGV